MNRNQHRVPFCPVCRESMNVSELTCPRCEVAVGGDFASCRFCRLSPDALHFVETFLRCEGNLSRVEKEIGLSYPTLRNRLHGALEALGLRGETETRGAEPEAPLPDNRRQTILVRLAAGEIDAIEAAQLLKEILN